MKFYQKDKPLRHYVVWDSLFNTVGINDNSCYDKHFTKS